MGKTPGGLGKPPISWEKPQEVGKTPGWPTSGICSKNRGSKLRLRTTIALLGRGHAPGPISSWRAALAAFKCFHNVFCNKSNTDFEGCAGGLQYSIWILIQHLTLRLLRLRLQPPRCFNPPAYRPLDRVACVESCFGIFHNLGTAIVAFGVVPIRIYF